MQNSTSVKKESKTDNHLVERAYSYIWQEIINGTYKQGEKFNQTKLAEQLKMSRTPIMKALNKMETEGFVTCIPQKGFHVRVLSIKDLVEAYILREVLEEIVLRSLDLSPAQIAKLKSCFEPFANKEIDIKAYGKADSQFHSMLVEFCDNSLAKRIVGIVKLDYLVAFIGLIRSPEETLSEHLDLIDALEKHDVETAAVLLRKHLSITKDKLINTAKSLSEIGLDPGSISVSQLSKGFL